VPDEKKLFPDDEDWKFFKRKCFQFKLRGGISPE
jgi:hypothetical protein